MSETETVRVTLRLPASVHAAIERKAKESVRSLNGQIVACLLSCIEPQEYHRTPSGAPAVNETGDAGAAPPETGEG